MTDANEKFSEYMRRISVSAYMCEMCVGDHSKVPIKPEVLARLQGANHNLGKTEHSYYSVFYMTDIRDTIYEGKLT